MPLDGLPWSTSSRGTLKTPSQTLVQADNLKTASIDLTALPWVPLDATAGFPSQPGIYFAIDSSNHVQYIGRSGNVRGRWRNHHKYEQLVAVGDICIVYLFANKNKLNSLENKYINEFNPPLNVARSRRKGKHQSKDDSSKLVVNVNWFKVCIIQAKKGCKFASSDGMTRKIERIKIFTSEAEAKEWQEHHNLEPSTNVVGFWNTRRYGYSKGEWSLKYTYSEKEGLSWFAVEH